MEMKSLFLILIVIALGSSTEGQACGLAENFYNKSCPQAEPIVQITVWNRVSSKPELAAKLLRMFFHDCFVRGCDASVLIDSTNGTAEKNGVPNLSLAGFDVIDEAKTAVEQVCPNTVSCADIVALAARDAVSFQFQKNLWEVQTGRRDGLVSQKQDALTNIPSPFFNFSSLLQSFASKGLSAQDLVVLSGAHTIGVGHCNLFTRRLYNFTGKGDADPSLNATYAAFLRTRCTPTDTTTTVPMDPESAGTTFDSSYFKILKQHQGLFVSDAALLTDQMSSDIVDELQDSENFIGAFRNSITRMGAIGVLTGISNGEIRKNCRAAN